MKKIIDGLRYDTAVGVKIGYYSNLNRGAASPSDYHWWEATLYHTPRSNRYFLAGEGGPMSIFSRSTGHVHFGHGERILPVSKTEAREWAEQYLDAEAIEKHFGNAIQDA